MFLVQQAVDSVGLGPKVLMRLLWVVVSMLFFKAIELVCKCGRHLVVTLRPGPRSV